LKKLCLNLLLLLYSCSYGFSNLKNPWKEEGVNTVTVSIFKNNTFEKDIEIYFTNALRSELNTRSTELIYSNSNPDAVFEGKITNVSINPAGRIYGTKSTELQGGLADKRVLAVSYNVSVSVNIKLIKLSNKKILWQNNFTNTTSFNSGSFTNEDQITNVFIKDSSKEEAIKNLATLMMQTIIDTVLSNL